MIIKQDSIKIQNVLWNYNKMIAKKNKFSENVTTLISKSTEINGDLHFSGTLEVEGKIRGNIYADTDVPAEVRIRESGLVQGEIKAPSFTFNSEMVPFWGA